MDSPLRINVFNANIVRRVEFAEWLSVPVRASDSLPAPRSSYAERFDSAVVCRARRLHNNRSAATALCVRAEGCAASIRTKLLTARSVDESYAGKSVRPTLLRQRDEKREGKVVLGAEFLNLTPNTGTKRELSLMIRRMVQYNARGSAALNSLRIMQCACSEIPNSSSFSSTFRFYAIATLS
ncbi:hypothetical protein EVAR_29684_1 [Eumeta japonica]|uniref:Uncharacterized protein n=1 Tax=Eumeta variegata TaxID=151549 RepID=A0A4C1VY38_EUMVA|nr:hypothetical protein EVAR_29684_1 [Eumeta japonica]